MNPVEVREQADYPRYQPSGRIDLPRSLPWLVLLALTIFVCAALLAVCFNLGWYGVLVMPLMASMILIGPIVPSRRSGTLA